MTKPILTESAQVTYGASMALTERHLVALSKVLAYGGAQCAEKLLAILPEREQAQARPGLIDLFESLREEVPAVIRKGQDARAVFSGLAEACRKDRAE